jgi:mannan endo-1,4-beta-mannosidase
MYCFINNCACLQEVARGKPIALAEVGSVPTPAVLQRQPEWVWFMVWAEYLKDPQFNTDDSVKATYYLNNVLHQGDIDLGGGGGDDGNLAEGRSVFASSVQNASFPKENVNDGRLDTRWSSNFEEEQWIYIDLGTKFHREKL